jgi:hypothetical protein
MNRKDIKTRRQLTRYLISQNATGPKEDFVFANFDSPMFWTDEPVSEMEVAAAIRDGRRGAGSSKDSPTQQVEILPGDVCPVCSTVGGCAHLLLIIVTDSQELVDGPLFEQLELLRDRFADLYAQVVARQAICGDGLVREATRAYFRGYGEIAGTGIYHAELDRDYEQEYLMDILDRAPNLYRTKFEDPDSSCEYIWSETPEAAVSLINDRMQLLQRLIDLPEQNSEWIPQDI